jgi:molybdate transport system regulatory protein
MNTWRLIDMSVHDPERLKLVGKLSIETALGAFLGDTRIRLLEAIERHGSISRAAKAVPMSYKAAWDAVDAMNNLAEAPLVESAVGGAQGGGTHLTTYGAKLIALYRAVEHEYQEAMERLVRATDSLEQGDQQAFRRLLKRMAIRSSARNQFVATVSALHHSEISTAVTLRVDADLVLAATITRESAETLALAEGTEVYAFIKASSVILSTDPSVRTSARNQLWGEVTRIHEGVVDAEVTLGVSGGRTVTAVVTKDSLTALELTTGQRACAVFKASSIILATLGG